MTENNQTNYALELLLADHRELFDEINGFRKWIAEVSELGFPHFSEMGHRLEQLRSRLRTHFEKEEQGGYMSSALKHTPHLAEEIQGLAEQHGEFLNTLDDFISRLEATEPEFASWQEAVAQFEDFLDTLLRHERRENAIARAGSAEVPDDSN